MMNRKFEIQNAKRLSAALAAVVLTVLVSGCGQSAYQEGGAHDGGGGYGGVYQPGTPNGGSGTGTGNGSGSGSTGTGSNDGTTNAPPSAQYDFKLTGNSSTSTDASGRPMTADTATLLKVTVRAGQHYAVPNTGYTAGFNCEQFTVTVLGQTQTVFVKSPGYIDRYYYYFGSDPCASAQESATLDFSGRLGPGHNTVTIQVSNAMYDNCRQWQDVQNGGCPMSSVYHSSYGSHYVGGHLDVTTNSIQ